jgi:hypothetical protein
MDLETRSLSANPDSPFVILIGDDFIAIVGRDLIGRATRPNLTLPGHPAHVPTIIK